MTVDSVGNQLTEGQECVFSRNLWRGKEVLCKGIITSIGDKLIKVTVTSPQPPDIDNIFEGWNISKLVKSTKVYGL
jgi:hypothetical protein